MTEFTLKTEDSLPVFRTTLDDDITGNSEVRIYVENASNNTLVVNDVMTVNYAKEGYIEYDFSEAQTAREGYYLAEVVVDYGGDGNASYPKDGYYTFEFNETLNRTAGVQPADASGTLQIAKLITEGDVKDDLGNLIYDYSAGHVTQSILENDSVTVTAGDGLKNGGAVALGSATTINVEPTDFAGTYLTDDGTDNLQVDIGRGLEGDGTGSIQFDEDTAYTFTAVQTLSAGAEVNGDVTDGATLIYDSSLSQVEQDALENDSVTVAGNLVSLGGSTAVSVHDLSDSGTVGLLDEAETVTPTWTFSGGLDTQGDVTDGTQTIWNATAQEIPDSAMGSIANATLTNDSVTVAGNTVSLGGSTAVSTGDLSGDTDGLTEGVSNLFYTDERAQDSVGTILGSLFTYDDATPAITLDEGELSHDAIDQTTVSSGDHHTRYADEEAQDAVGTILGANFTYDDATPAISLASDSVTVTAGDSLTGGGTIALGGTTTIDLGTVEESHLATDYVEVAGDTVTGDLTLDGSRLLTAGTGTSSVTVRDTANAQDLAVFNEGGPVSIPNNEVKLSDALNLDPRSEPSSPTTGLRLYVDSTDGSLKGKDDAGTVTTIVS